jgi:hypothetical protein
MRRSNLHSPYTQNPPFPIKKPTHRAFSALQTPPSAPCTARISSRNAEMRANEPQMPGVSSGDNEVGGVYRMAGLGVLIVKMRGFDSVL